MTAGRHAISETKNWCTPQKYVDAVYKVFGAAPDLDPCSNDDSIVGATVEFKLPEHDGLRENWSGYKHIYVNPPYGNDKVHGTAIRHWFAKIAEARAAGNEVIALVPVATNTMHWKRYVYPVADVICFLYDTRLKFFINGKEDTKGAPMSCSMIYYGDQADAFIDVFKEFGACLPLRDAKLPPKDTLF